MKTIALANQKGGVGKTTTAASLGIGLSRQGKKVLLIDADAQGNLTQMLGWPQPDELSPTLSTLMEKIIAEQPITPDEGILHHSSGVHLVPANIELSALEVTLVNTMSRETVLRQYLSTVAERYDYALIDCMPSLGMLTINALTAADSVIIPVQAQYLPAKGLEQLLRTITRVKRQLNPKLEVDGIVLTMVDSRTTLAREINALVRKTYGGHVFASEIPRSIKAAEISVENKRYGVLFYPIVNKVEKTGTVEIMAKAKDAKQINRIFERMGYPAPVKEDTAAKKENARAPSENSSKERGTGARASTEPATEKADARPSVRSRLMALQAAAERDGTAPTKDTVREAIQKAMPTRE